MAGTLYNERSAGSRYNFKDDMQMLMIWIEQLREVNGSDFNEAADGLIYIAGVMPLGVINRIRGAAGMTALEPSPAREGSTESLCCGHPPSVHTVTGCVYCPCREPGKMGDHAAGNRAR